MKSKVLVVHTKAPNTEKVGDFPKVTQQASEARLEFHSPASRPHLLPLQQGLLTHVSTGSGRVKKGRNRPDKGEDRPVWSSRNPV